MSSCREFITLLGGVAAWPRGVLAQATSRRAMIAWVWSSSQSNFDEYVRTGKFVPPFLKGMREFGHTEGRDFDMVHGFANGEYDRMPKVAAELAELNPNVFIAPATAQAVAVRIQRVDALPAKASQPAGSESCRDGGNIVLEA